ncbi:fumarylacetoacetate hydrolase family protein [Microbulbifer pacificus]|uniref:Fumarylacetoacetate hydrolase family protein n=1 Tax=Microbulbifer pacificus TaxID=407164 RepID=A0AAU0N4I8_9GAMM|nr:fumarylacetoacetate hydrolase family protein [Microbulbifer pacificus]WOX07019.1 fumarylacetoacetate hydrolase family protein [Microbulbifer pacificus]
MKFGSYRNKGKTGFGAIRGDYIVDLTDIAPDLKSFLAAGRPAMESAHAAVAASNSVISIDEVELLPPIPNPGTIWCVGLNTHSHFEEVKAALRLEEKPSKPILFLRSSATLVPSGQDLEKPALENAFDYEGEIALIIGKRARNVSISKAMDCVAGFAPFNDGSAREYQMSSNQVTAGKNAYRSGGFGPYLVTSDEVDASALSLTTRLNGDLVQEMFIEDLIFGFAELVSYISEFTWLEPGDVIVTGSPAGIGFTTKNLLKAGDKVEVEVQGVGTLVNGVRDQEH